MQLMGVLTHVTSGRSVALPVHAVAGRAPTCAVLLADHSASNHHASVLWTGERWEVRDLGSTNNTYVGDTKIPLRENSHLARGAIVRFGSAAERWELVDDSPPGALARSMTTGEVRRAAGDQLALPDPDDILATIVMDSEGTWFVEMPPGSRRPAQDREQITIAGTPWELSVPQGGSVLGTVQLSSSLKLASLTLHFHVSRDQEHVRIDAVDGDTLCALGERACFYMLLLLARERRDNAADVTLAEGEHGWIHVTDLMKDLNVDERHLNVLVYRIREAFGKAQVSGAEGIVQRRPKQIRIGIARIVEIKS